MYIRSVKVALVLLLVVCLGGSLPAWAQSIDGSLTGTVYDPSGAAVYGAQVTVVNVATGQTQTSTTKSLGDYRFNDLPVGTYNISASSPNFKTTTLTNIPVELNKIGTANIKLQVGSSATTVEVSGVAPPVDTSSAQLQSTYDSSFAQDLGIVGTGGTGAGVLNLSLLSPGVTNASAMNLGEGPSVGGQRPRDNNFTIEGVDNNNKTVTGALITVPNDAVENFTVLENQFNAEFGHSSGGQFNTTIKSGTNGFHGSLYEYFRNRNLNAVDNFYVLQGITRNPRFDSNRYGGTLGGPIVKNKLFFFTNFERQPIGTTGTGGIEALSPTAAGYAAIQTDPSLSATNLAIFQKYMPVAAAPAGAANGGCIEYDSAARPGEAGQIGAYNAPANGSCPAGTVEVGAISFAAPAFSNYENFVQSVDYNMSGKDQIRGRFVYNKLDTLDTVANLPAFYLTEPARFNLFTLSEYHTFTPSLLNEFRVGYNRFATNDPAGNFGYPGLDAFPNVLLNDLGGVNIGPDPNAPQETIQNFYNGVDNVTWTKGAHTLKFGGEYRWYISPQTFTQRQRGDYEYNSSQMFLEDFSPDIIGERSQGTSVYYGNQKGIYGYANDTWRVDAHLTLNLGVRWEYNTVPIGEQRQSLNAASSQPGIIVSGVNEPLIFGTVDSPKKNFAPRLGFAYSPGENGNTSIRGGFGMAYDVLYDNIGILAPPPQLGATNDVPDLNTGTPNFLGSGGLNGGGSGITPNCNAATVAAGTPCVDAIAATSAWIPPHTKWPYSINWNLGVQHSFGKDFTGEINYVGDRGVHLDVQDRINRRSLVSPSAFLPTYLQAPSQATLDALPNTLTSLEAPGNIVPAYRNLSCNDPNFNNSCTFDSSIVADLPLGSSNYNGLETQLRKRFRGGLAFQASYTYSRTIDNDTADFFTTSLTPRRPQDFFNFAAERSVSPLSRTHRLTIAAVYNLPYFKSGNWLMKNVVGNWVFTPIYTYESPEWADVQSASDANLNGDSAGDRAIFNPAGVPGTGSGITTLMNSSGDVVAYLAKNPSAQYIKTGAGALANSGRNTLATEPTDDVDFGVYKDLNLTERFKFRLGAQFANILNHPQFIPGNNPGLGLGVNDVTGFTTTSGGYLNYLTPGNVNFNNPKSVFGSSARTIGLVAKITF